MIFPTHHRNVPYRPPRRQEDRRRGSGALYVRFARQYLMPYRGTLLLCMAIVCLSGSSVYLMAFYGRYVVDSVLQVGAGPEEPASVAALGSAMREPVTTDPDRGARGDDLPAEGFGRSLDRDPAGPRHSPGAGRRLLFIFLLHFSTVVVLNGLARVANRKQIILGQEITAQLREDLHQKVLELSLAYHKSHTAGRLLSRIMSDVGQVQQHLMMTVITLAQALCSVIVGASILLLSDWRMGVIALLATPLYAVVWLRTREPIRQLSAELRHTNSCMYGLISQKLESVKAIQAYAREGRERLHFHRLSGCMLRDAVHQQRQSAVVGHSCNLIAAFATTAIFLYGTSLVLRNEMSLGKMLFIYGSAANLFGPVLMITQVGVAFSQLLVILQRLVDILDEPIQITAPPDAQPFPAPLRKGITVEELSFAYGEGDPILRDVSLVAPAGQWVCIMGPSGCGKTSLLYLLARLYEPTGGRIAVDGMPLGEIALASLRERMALVPQEAQIFRGTVRDNISYGFPHASPREIMTAAKAAEMHDLVLSLPVRYETVIGERGADLSGGQRQRLSLARALITSPDVLLLDDCTSALDAETEQKIQHTLSRIMKGKTAIIVSQRVSMAMRCDHVYVMTRGAITEQGTHEDLLRQDGFYARLHRQQTE